MSRDRLLRTTPLRIRCGGVDVEGEPVRCPEQFLMAVGNRPRDGLSLNALHTALRRTGWSLGVGKTPVPETLVARTQRETRGGPPPEVAYVEPLCPRHTEALVGRVTEDGRAPMDPGARDALVREGLLPARVGTN